jgi:hypothetical protein
MFQLGLDRKVKEAKIFKHGIGGYTFHKCRCDVCKNAARFN